MPLTKHHLHDLEEVWGVLLVVNDADLSAAASFAVPDATSQCEALHKDHQGFNPNPHSKFSNIALDLEQ